MKKHERPEVTTSYTVRELTGCGKMYVTIGKDNGQVIEVLAVLGKGGNCAAAQNEAITRAVSLGLKYGVPLKEYMKELSDIKCPYSTWEDGDQKKSCADAIARVLKGELNGTLES